MTTRPMVHRFGAPVVAVACTSLLLVSCVSGLVGSAVPPSMKAEVEPAAPLKITKDEATKIKVIAVAHLSGAAGQGAMMTSMMVSQVGGADEIRLLTEALEKSGRFKIIAARQFINAVADIRESFDHSLTGAQRLEVAGRAGRALNADAVLIFQSQDLSQGPTLGGTLVGGLVTGRTESTVLYRIEVVSSGSNAVLWSQQLKLNITYGVYSLPSEDATARAGILPLVDSLVKSFGER